MQQVYNVDTGMIETMKFLRMNNIDPYNYYSMGHVDLSDQLRDQCRMNYWLRKRKRWWSIHMWGLGVKITNAYIMYKTCWINPEEYGNELESGAKRSLFPNKSDGTRQGRGRKTQSDNVASVSSLSAYYNVAIQIKKAGRVL